jgi:uncharacterized membrane protein YkoI
MRDHNSVAIGLVLVLVVSALSLGVGAATASSSADAASVAAQQDGPDGDGPVDPADVNASELDVTALDAAQVAAEETDLKPVAVKLVTEDGVRRYSVLAVSPDGNVTGVAVDPTDGSIVRQDENIGVVNPAAVDDQGSFADVDNLRSAADAIEAARETVGNDTVPIEVAFVTERGAIHQRVTFATPDDRDELTRVTVDATEGPVVGVDRPGDETTATAENDTQSDEQSTDGNFGEPAFYDQVFGDDDGLGYYNYGQTLGDDTSAGTEDEGLLTRP